jgi:hypothetical protein
MTRAERSEANREAWRARFDKEKERVTVNWPNECDDPERYLSERWAACRDALSQTDEPEKWMPIERAAARELRIYRDNMAAVSETEIDRVRRLHRYALEDGSWAVSSSLEKRLSALEKAQREAEEAARRGLSANKIDALVEAIRRLPKPAQAQILAMLSAGDGVGAH